jgi:hypothetical protein
MTFEFWIMNVVLPWLSTHQMTIFWIIVGGAVLGGLIAWASSKAGQGMVAVGREILHKAWLLYGGCLWLFVVPILLVIVIAILMFVIPKFVKVIDVMSNGGNPTVTQVATTATPAAVFQTTCANPYHVVSGDTWYGIAEACMGDGNSYPVLQTANATNSTTQNGLDPGDLVYIP